MDNQINYDAPYLTLTALDDGSVEIEAHNFEGKTCDSATQFLRSDLLGESLERTNKPEYTAVKTGGLAAKSKGQVKL